MRAGNGAFVFDRSQAADVNDEVAAATKRRQLIAGAFDIAKRQTESFPRLSESRAGKHKVLEFGWDRERQQSIRLLNCYKRASVLGWSCNFRLHSSEQGLCSGYSRFQFYKGDRVAGRTESLIPS